MVFKDLCVFVLWMKVALALEGLNLCCNKLFVCLFAGKFKQGMHGVEERLVPLNPQELLELLKSHDHSSVVDVKDGSVISNRDLRLLLDRNDLHQIWKNKKEQSEKTSKFN